jgi:hypothetical protein
MVDLTPADTVGDAGIHGIDPRQRRIPAGRLRWRAGTGPAPRPACTFPVKNSAIITNRAEPEAVRIGLPRGDTGEIDPDCVGAHCASEKRSIAVHAQDARKL